MRQLIVVVCLAGLATPALAQEGQQEVGPSVQVVAGAGFGGLTSNLGYNSDIGASWAVRGGVDFGHFFGGELNYQGASSSASTVVTPGGALSGSHMTVGLFSADAKAGIPLIVANRVLQPYGIIGIGYGHIGVDSSLGTIGLTSQDAAVFPFGVGLTYNITRMFLIDARYTYNVLTESSGNTWNMGFNLGARFGG
jgi:opacity protein-like surface antigen